MRNVTFEYEGGDARTREMLSHPVLVSTLALSLGCTVPGSGGGGGDDDGNGADDGGTGATDGSGELGVDGPPAEPPDVIACSEPQDGALALEFTYDAAPDVTGGTIELQGSETWSLTQPAGSGRIGALGVRSELRYGDPQAYGGPRAETAVVGESASRYSPGDSFYYGFSVFVPAGWIDDGGVEDIMFQWHNIPDTNEAAKSPNLFLAIKRTEFVLRITSDATPISTPATELKEQALLVPDLHYDQGTWHDFVFHVVWSYQGADGLIEAWHKRADQTGYNKVLEKTGPNMHNDTLRGYVKWGIYKPAWRDGPTAPPVRVDMHDEIRVGESFGAVEPGCAR